MPSASRENATRFGQMRWSYRVEWFNQTHGTDYAGERDLLIDLYQKYKNCTVISGLFSGCEYPIGRHGIIGRVKKYVDLKQTQSTLKKYLLNNFDAFSEMTTDDIFSHIQETFPGSNYSILYVRQVIYQNRIPCKKIPRNLPKHKKDQPTYKEPEFKYPDITVTKRQSPCRQCDGIDKSKDCRRCMECPLRVEYHDLIERGKF